MSKQKTYFTLLTILSGILVPRFAFTSISLPTRENVLLFKALAPRMVTALPDSTLKPALKEKLSQVIIAGSDIFDLALAIDSGEFSSELKEALNNIRNEFKRLNTKLVNESKTVKLLKEKLQAATTPEQRSLLLEQQISAMLDMFTSMATPMNTISVAFNELNSLIFSKLINILEIIPPIAPYLMIGSKGDTITLSKFMQIKFKEMSKYTEALEKIGNNLTLSFDALKQEMQQCKKDLMNSAQQKALLQKSAQTVQKDVSSFAQENRLLPLLTKTVSGSPITAVDPQADIAETL